jgi:hypothetical protein
MQAECHIWKTADGELVAAENPKAATLAYAPGDEVAPKDEDKVRSLSAEDPEPEPDAEVQDEQAKQAAPGEDKAAKRGGDKAK